MISTKLIFLSSSESDKFRKKELPDGSFEPITPTRNVTSHEVIVNTLMEFRDVLAEGAAKGWCLIKGPKLSEPIINDSRSGKVDPSAVTNYMVLDFDDVNYHPGLEAFMREVFPGIGYVYHYSSNQKFNEHGNPLHEAPIRAHVFVRLSKFIDPSALKHIIEWVNLTMRTVELSDTTDTLKYKLDLRLALNTQIIYIQNPKLIEGSQKDDSWYQFHAVNPNNSSEEALIWDPKPYLEKSISSLAKKRLEVLNDLRARHGYSERNELKRKNITSRIQEIEYADPMDITTEIGHRTITSYISNPTPLMLRKAAYSNKAAIYLEPIDAQPWHPKSKLWLSNKTKSGYIKAWNDDAYTAHLRDVCPALWRQIQAEWAAEEAEALHESALKGEANERHDVFRDEKNDKYFGVSITVSENTVKFFKTPLSNKDRINDFYLNRSLPFSKDTPIPDASFGYDPSLCTGMHQRPGRSVFVNTYVGPTIIPKEAFKPEEYATPPKLIDYIIRHNMSYHPDYVGKMYDWMAWIVQSRKRANTAWILTGTHGSGKDSIRLIMETLLGSHNCITADKKLFISQFDDFLDNIQFLYGNEITTYKSNIESKPGIHGEDNAIGQRVKTIVNGDKLTMRRMFTAAEKSTIDNVINAMFASNSEFPMVVEPGDRRFFVVPYQTKTLMPEKDIMYAWYVAEHSTIKELTEDEIEQIRDAFSLRPNKGPFTLLEANTLRSTYGLPTKGSEIIDLHELFFIRKKMGVYLGPQMTYDDYAELIAAESQKFYHYLKEIHVVDYDNMSVAPMSTEKQRFIDGVANFDLAKVSGELRSGRVPTMLDTISEHLNVMIRTGPVPVAIIKDRQKMDEYMVTKNYLSTFYALFEHVINSIADPYLIECQCGTLTHIHTGLYNAKVLANARYIVSKNKIFNGVDNVTTDIGSGQYFDPKAKAHSMWDIIEHWHNTKGESAAETFIGAIPFPGFGIGFGDIKLVQLAKNIKNIDTNNRELKLQYQCPNDECFVCYPPGQQPRTLVTKGGFRTVYEHGCNIAEYPWNVEPDVFANEMFDGEVMFPIALTTDSVAMMLAGNARNPRNIGDLVNTNPTIKHKTIKTATGGAVSPRQPRQNENVMLFDAESYNAQRKPDVASLLVRPTWGIPPVRKLYYIPMSFCIDYIQLIELYCELNYYEYLFLDNHATF